MPIGSVDEIPGAAFRHGEREGCDQAAAGDIVFDAMSDTQFRRWTRAVIACIATVYFVRGLILLLDPAGATAGTVPL